MAAAAMLKSNAHVCCIIGCKRTQLGKQSQEPQNESHASPESTARVATDWLSRQLVTKPGPTCF